MFRRQFLAGAGGFTLALPFLPSLLSRSTYAAEPAPVLPRRFVAMATDHGGIWTPNMFPNPATLTENQTYAGHTIRRGKLEADVQGERRRLSPVLTASSTVLTERMVEKINVLQGLDVPYYLAHHTGGHLGNFARNDGNGDDGDYVRQFPRPTIDQIMAWSPHFYPNLDGVLERVLSISNTGSNAKLSYVWSNPTRREGDIQSVPTEMSSLRLFNRIFVPAEDPNDARPPVVDRVIENYRRLRQSNRRLSAEDRRRLDDHIERIHELQRRLNATVSCGAIQTPTRDSRTIQKDTADYNYNPEAMKQFFQLHNDVIAAAFACGTSRIAVIHCRNTFSEFQGDWHQDVAHRAKGVDGVAQTTITDAHQRFFEDVFVDLIQKLDIEEAPGTTMLDNSLVMWSQECGNFTHQSNSLPVVTAGSAQGYFRTGQYVDYRNLDKVRVSRDLPGEDRYAGLIYNQWLGNVLDAMGIPKAEYEQDDVGGYGVFYIGKHSWYRDVDAYPLSVKMAMGDKLPWIAA